MGLPSVALPCLLVAASLQLSAGAVLEFPDSRRDAKVAARRTPQWLEELERASPEETLKKLPKVVKRAAGDNGPQVTGRHTFGDQYNHGIIHYSGKDSDAIFVLTYRLKPQKTNLYRSADYGVSFVNINNRLDSDPSLVLSSQFFVSDFNRNLLIFPHATLPVLYITKDEGVSFEKTYISPKTFDPGSIKFHPTKDGWLMGLTSNRSLYMTSNYSSTWKKVDDNVIFYRWCDPNWDTSLSSIYYTTADPTDSTLPLELFVSKSPYDERTLLVPNIDHNGFALVGPYMFAQTSENDTVQLRVSYNRKPFHLAYIPTPYAHKNYIVRTINELQALVIIEHEGGFFNLYLSDLDGLHYSLSLRDIVVVNGVADLEMIEGVNGTHIANQYVRDDPSVKDPPIRTLISRDNGALWELILPPDEDVGGNPVNCEPPSCSLHFHMATSEYSRLGVSSTSSAPGIILAHGSTGERLTDNPNLYISRDGGVTWEETLSGSWGVNVADYGGLMVAAKDYHRPLSNELMYSCDEGYSWKLFYFDSVSYTIYGVITEPGKHTTIMSLYGYTSQRGWVVITIEFQHIFTRNCDDNDYTLWVPWDERSGNACVLGSSVSIERRKARVCCLNGREYVREINYRVCKCTSEDYECDYGYARPSNDLNGPCAKDPSVMLPDPCSDGMKDTYNASTGYRKIASDMCEGGVDYLYWPIEAHCCGNTTQPPTPRTLTSIPTTTTTTTETTDHGLSSSGGVASSTIGVSVVLVIVCVAALIFLGLLVTYIVKFSTLRTRYFRLATSGEEGTRRFAFNSDRENSLEPFPRGDHVHEGDTHEPEDDDALLVP